MANVYQSDMTGKPKPSQIKRSIVVVLLTIVMFGSAIFGGLYILLKGPSPYAGGLFADRVEDVPVISSIVEWIAGEKAFPSDSGQQVYSIYPQID